MYDYPYDPDSIMLGLLSGLALLVFAGLLAVRVIRGLRGRRPDRSNNEASQPYYSTIRPSTDTAQGLAENTPSQTIDIVARSSVRTGLKGERAEIDIDIALRKLDHGNYMVFRDLIIPTGRQHPSLTQIDHVVVSTYGIFCIETKSNSGYIYGYTRSDKWTQYLAREKYRMHSPFRQNMYHVRSLERYLHGILRAPVHSYLAFPNARKVVIDGKEEDLSVTGIVSKIQNHNYKVYEPPTVVRIAKSLAYIASKRDELRDRHVDEVREYLNKRMERKA